MLVIYNTKDETQRPKKKPFLAIFPKYDIFKLNFWYIMYWKVTFLYQILHLFCNILWEKKYIWKCNFQKWQKKYCGHFDAVCPLWCTPEAPRSTVQPLRAHGRGTLPILPQRTLHSSHGSWCQHTRDLNRSQPAQYSPHASLSLCFTRHKFTLKKNWSTSGHLGLAVAS